MATIGKNQVFEIKNGDGTSFHNLVLRKSAVESVVMSLGDKISGDVYYKDNTLSVTMHEYITYNGVNYMLINPPTIVKEGVVSDNSELKGMTKYSFVFYHPMCQLSNFPFTDVAVTSDETRYLSESKVFSWIGKPADFIAKMNKNLVGTVWIVELSFRFPQDKLNEISDVIPFDNATIADACKVFYDTWGVPYVVDKVASTETSYAAGKRFKLVMGLPSNEIYENAQAEQQNTPFVFQMGQGVGLKNNSRTPRNNKIITRISGYGSENNIPYGYPQVRWYGTAGQAFTYGDHAGVYNDVTIEGVHFDKIISYPIYKGILDGEYVELIKHPFTRTHLMPSVYRTTLFNKISFYDAAGEANTDYDPDITLVDYYDAVYSAQYPYPNTINLQAPSYESHEFEDEKPELGEAHIISATPLNNDLTPASSWDDSLDDEGNYKQSYFQMVLPQLSFDLYACASITEEMQINMRSGACLGCTFTVQVDWDDYKRNFYDEDGNFAPNGSQRDLTKYPKSDQGSIALVLQKDNSTFGTLMPNMYQYPKGETSSGAGDGDTFVILGISLPESYIFSAEWRLDADMKSYMLENNVHYFDYPLKFDEDFLFHNENILSQIRPNTIVRFNYAGQTQALFVKQITVKYGDQPLPQYDITLTDNVEVVLNQIGQVAEDVEKLSTLIAILRQSYGKNVWNELAKKLSKTQDDTAAGYITMLKGLQIGASFIPDILGEGGVLRMNNDGKVELVVDTLYARMRAYFDSVVIREYRHESGNRIKSPAQGFNASRVEYIKVVSGTETIVDDASDADYFRCYWRVDDGEKKAENQFIIGDLAFCEHSDVVNGSLVTKRYWRVVTGRNAGNTTTADGEAWIDLSNAKDGSGNPVMTTITYEGQGGTTQTKSVLSFESGSGYPEAHDDICMLGCTTDTTRQGAIIEYVSGVDAPAYQIYQGLGADATNPYLLTNKNQISIGYNSATGKADMKVYGDAYIGARDRSTFIEYKQDDGTQQHAPVLNIKAKIQILPNGSTIDGESISDYIKDNQNNYDDTEVQQAISDLNDAVGNLQDQIDGSIETLYGDVDPSVPANDPYKDYTTDEKEKHLGDMYYNSTTGYAYRYDKSVEGEGEQQVTTYFWQIIRDTGITQAIAEAGRALGLADTKAKVFTTNAGTLPSPPYKVNDVWVNATYPADGSTYANEILKCVTAREQGATANIADWVKASKYTDDSSLQNFISATYDPAIAGLTEQVDRKIESWFQSADPSTDWYDDTQTPVLDVRADHVGDMWYSESTHLLKRYDSKTTGEGEQAVTTYFWTTIQDQKAIDAYDNAAHAQDTADGKRRVFTAQPTTDDVYDVGDLWVNATYPATGDKTYENDVLRCKTAKASGVEFDIAHWQKASKYTDDTALTDFVNGDYAETIGALEGQLDKKAETWYQAENPATPWYVVDHETQEVTTDTRADHVGDLWYKTTDDTTWYYKSTTTGEGEQAVTTYEWVQQNVPLAVFDKIDGKADIFVSKPSTYNINDMWIIESDTTTCPDASIPDGCKRGDIVISNHKRTNSYQRGDWSKKDRYTDDSKFNGYISALLSGSGASGDSATAAAIQRAITTALGSALGSATLFSGGLMLTSMIGMRQLTGSDPSSISDYTTWGGISGEYNPNDETEQGGAKGHGIAAWYGGDMVDKEMLSDDDIAAGWGATLPDESTNFRWARSLFRFDGSGYVADANITWTKEGALTIKNITTLSDSNNNNILNELATFNSAFTFGTSGQGSTTALYITPQVPFETLYVGTSSANKKEVATQEWVGNNYISKTWFNNILKVHYKASAEGADTILSPNNNLPSGAVDVSLESVFSFWTNYAISALGQGVDGSHAIGVLNDLNDVTIDSTTLVADQILKYNGTQWVNDDAPETYVLPQATAEELGGIKIGYTASGKNYPVVLDNGKAYVNVPWTDTTYDLSGYLQKSGGTMTGPLQWNDSNALPQNSSPAYFLTLDAFADGGTTKWATVDALKTSLGLGSNAYTSTSYLPTGGGTMTGNLNLNNAIWLQGKDTNGTLYLLTGLDSGNNFVLGYGTAGAGYSSYLDGNNIYLRYGTSRTNGMILDSSGNVGIGTSSPSYKLQVSGSFYASGNSSVGGTFGVTGATTLTGLLTANGGIVVPSSNTIKIGDAILAWDSTNTALKLYKLNGSTEVAVNFYATGGIAALGSTGSGGGGGQGDVTWALLADNTDTRQIALSHLTTALSGYLPLSGGTISTGGYLRFADGTYQLSVSLNDRLSIGNTSQSAAQGLNVGDLLVSSAWADYDKVPTNGIYSKGVIRSGVTSGTAPFTIASTSVVTNLNADFLDGQHGSYYAAASALSNYLPLSGGTLASTIRKILTLNQTDSSGAGPYIQFNINGTNRANFGVNTSVGSFIEFVKNGVVSALILDDSNIYYKNKIILREDNWSSYVGTSSSYVGYATNATKATQDSDGNAINSTYLKKSGGTMTGDLTVNGQSKFKCAYFNETNPSLGALGTGTFVINACASDNTSRLDYGLYIWVDWYHGTAKLQSGYNNGATTALGLALQPLGGKVGIGYSGDVRQLGYTLTVNGSINGTSVYYNGNACIHAGNIGSQSVNYASSAGAVAWANVSGKPNVMTTDTTQTVSGAKTFSDIRVNNIPKDTSMPYFLGVEAFDDGGRIKWVAKADTKVGYAAKLETSRSIWGQSFDGSANIGIDTVATMPYIYFKKYNSNSEAGYCGRGYSDNNRIVLTGYSGSELSLGANGTNNVIYINNSLNVGIGNTSPSYKLDVNDSTSHPLRVRSSAAECSIVFASANSTASNGNFVLGSYNTNASGTHPFFFVYDTALTSQVVHIENGLTGLGTTSPLAELDVRGQLRVLRASYDDEVARFLNHTAAPWGLFFKCVNGTNGAFSIQNKREANNTEYFPLILNYQGGNVGVGTTDAPSYKLHVVGDIYATGGVTCASDIRLKDVLSYQLPLTVEQVAQAPTIKFLWKNKREEGEQVGSIAQYWQKVLPEAVTHKSDELGLQYGVAALVAAITTARKVVDHEKRITELEKERDAWKEAYSFIKNAYEELKLKIA